MIHQHYEPYQILWFLRHFWQYTRENLIEAWNREFHDTEFGKSQYQWLKARYGFKLEWGAALNNPPYPGARPGAAGYESYVPSTIPAQAPRNTTTVRNTSNSPTSSRGNTSSHAGRGGLSNRGGPGAGPMGQGLGGLQIFPHGLGGQSQLMTSSANGAPGTYTVQNRSSSIASNSRAMGAMNSMGNMNGLNGLAGLSGLNGMHGMSTMINLQGLNNNQDTGNHAPSFPMQISSPFASAPAMAGMSSMANMAMPSLTGNANGGSRTTPENISNVYDSPFGVSTQFSAAGNQITPYQFTAGSPATSSSFQNLGGVIDLSVQDGQMDQPSHFGHTHGHTGHDMFSTGVPRTSSDNNSNAYAMGNSYVPVSSSTLALNSLVGGYTPANSGTLSSSGRFHNTSNVMPAINGRGNGRRNNQRQASSTNTSNSMLATSSKRKHSHVSVEMSRAKRPDLDPALSAESPAAESVSTPVSEATSTAASSTGGLGTTAASPVPSAPAYTWYETGHDDCQLHTRHAHDASGGVYFSSTPDCFAAVFSNAHWHTLTQGPASVAGTAAATAAVAAGPVLSSQMTPTTAVCPQDILHLPATTDTSIVTTLSASEHTQQAVNNIDGGVDSTPATSSSSTAVSTLVAGDVSPQSPRGFGKAFDVYPEASAVLGEEERNLELLQMATFEQDILSLPLVADEASQCLEYPVTGEN